MMHRTFNSILELFLLLCNQFTRLIQIEHRTQNYTFGLSEVHINEIVHFNCWELFKMRFRLRYPFDILSVFVICRMCRNQIQTFYFNAIQTPSRQIQHRNVALIDLNFCKTLCWKKINVQTAPYPLPCFTPDSNAIAIGGIPLIKTVSIPEFVSYP